MAPSLHISNARVVRPGVSADSGSVLISDGKISAINEAAPHGVESLDAGGSFLTPGLIDLHTHGIGHIHYEGPPENLAAAAGILPRFGTTSVLPTIVRLMDKTSHEHLRKVAEAMEAVVGMRFPGFHLEGPFLALPGAGCQCVPGDVQLLEDILDACRHRVTAMSVSPDTPNILPVIERLVEHQIVPFLTHTRATVEQTIRAIDAGAVHATHFYDVFPIPEESDPGVRPCGAVETLLADPRCSVDFIADGVHVHPMAIRCALAAKGFRGVMLITDSNIGAGLPEGIHPTNGGYSVRVRPGDAARIVDEGHPKQGALAGSALTMDEGIRNLMKWLPLPPEQIWAMATSNPADLIGAKTLGRIEPGSAADLVLWDENLRPRATWVAGRLVFQNDKSPLAENASSFPPSNEPRSR